MRSVVSLCPDKVSMKVNQGSEYWPRGVFWYDDLIDATANILDRDLSSGQASVRWKDLEGR